MNKKFYKLVLTIFKPIFLMLYPMEVRGAENINNIDSGYIICCNHLFCLDPVFLMISNNTPIHFMAKSELFKNRFLNWFLTKMGAFGVKRGKGDKTAITKSESILKSNEVLGIFIEGTRSKTGEFLRPKSGAALIANDVGSPVLPVCITGTHKSGKIKIFHKTIVSYGKMIPIEDIKVDGFNRLELKKATGTIMSSIMDLRGNKG